MTTAVNTAAINPNSMMMMYPDPEPTPILSLNPVGLIPSNDRYGMKVDDDVLSPINLISANYPKIPSD